MTRSRTAVVLAVCAVVAVAMVATAVATAAYKTGKYEGTTSQGYKIGFKAKKLGVKKFSFRVDVPCVDGTVWALKAGGAQAPTNKKGKFTAVFVGEGTTVVKGQLKRKKASGTIESTGVTNQQTGSSCSGEFEWSARKQ